MSYPRTRKILQSDTPDSTLGLLPIRDRPLATSCMRTCLHINPPAKSLEPKKVGKYQGGRHRNRNEFHFGRVITVSSLTSSCVRRLWRDEVHRKRSALSTLESPGPRATLEPVQGQAAPPLPTRHGSRLH